MTTVQVSGWNIGFNKVGFTHLLKSDLGYPLSRAKRVTDTIMKNEAVELEVADAQLEQLLSSMRSLGAQCGAVVAYR